MIQDYSNPGLVHLAGQSQQELELKKESFTQKTAYTVTWDMPNFDTLRNKWTVKGYTNLVVDNKSN